LTSVLLSIKPKYANAIIEGVKRYEFRRVIFRRRITSIYIYSTSPISKIVGLFEIDQIIKGHPQEIWNMCHEHAGISGDEFFNYFGDLLVAYAIKVRNAHRFDREIDPYDHVDNFKPPQSFCYVPHLLIRDAV